MQGTFSYEQIKAGNLCAEYSQEPDGSDKGTWRMPNQRELMVMLMVWEDKKATPEQNFIKEMQVGTASRTYYKEPDKTGDNRIFFVQDNHGLFVTSQALTGSKFHILPVRDVQN